MAFTNHNCAKINRFHRYKIAKVLLGTELKVWKVGARRNLPWEIDETWCCCACRRFLCVPLGMQFTALPIQSASSTLATVLPGMLCKTLDCCRGRLQVIPDPKWISPGTRIFRFQGDFYLVPCADLLHGVNSSAASLPSVQVSRQWEWFICGLCQLDGGRSKTGETD